MRRRMFVKEAAGMFAFAPFAGKLFADEKPLFRMGVMTDTHVGKDVKSCERVKMALELFKKQGCEMVVNNGDIADHFYPTGYTSYRQVSDAVYAGVEKKPREVFVYAWHDAYDYKGHPRDQVGADSEAAFKEVRELLKAPNAPTDSFEFHGIPILVFHQFEKTPVYEKMLAETAAKYPGKPIFVFSHVPAGATVYDSWNWGDMRQTNIYKKYPQVVSFSGHVHGSLRSDQFIWQREFTVVNSGCLQVWSGLLANGRAHTKHEYGVLVIDVFGDRLLVRRFDVRDGREICPDKPWNVALVPNGTASRYSPETKRRLTPVPQFDAGAKITVTPATAGAYKLTFPEITGPTHAYLYRAEVQKKDAAGQWQSFTLKEIMGDYHLRACDQTHAPLELEFESAYFTPGEQFRFSVTPCNECDAGGRSVTAEFTVPAGGETFETVFDLAAPTPEQLPLIGYDLKNKPYRPKADGFYDNHSGRMFLVFPKGSFKAPAGTKFRLVCDFHMVQPAEGSLWCLTLKDAETGKAPAGFRVSTPPGDRGTVRYVFEFVKDAKCPSDDMHLLFKWGGQSKVAIRRVKLDHSAIKA